VKKKKYVVEKDLSFLRKHILILLYCFASRDSREREREGTTLFEINDIESADDNNIYT
jgi:hypothetical protein